LRDRYLTNADAPPFLTDSYIACTIATALRASGPHVSASFPSFHAR
jgi:hypothetical protein